MQRTIGLLSPKHQISECRSSTVCLAVERPDHHCGDDLVCEALGKTFNGLNIQPIKLAIFRRNADCCESGVRLSVCNRCVLRLDGARKAFGCTEVECVGEISTCAISDSPMSTPAPQNEASNLGGLRLPCNYSGKTVAYRAKVRIEMYCEVTCTLSIGYSPFTTNSEVHALAS